MLTAIIALILMINESEASIPTERASLFFRTTPTKLAEYLALTWTALTAPYWYSLPKTTTCRALRIREITLGFALGILVGMSPYLGFHTAIAVFLAVLFKRRKALLRRKKMPRLTLGPV